MSTIYKRLRTNELASINKDAFENRNSRLHITLKHFFSRNDYQNNANKFKSKQQNNPQQP